MKIFAIVALLFSMNLFANDLTEKQSEDLLTEFDNICGDTWCEGDFNFSFESFECSIAQKKCHLNFTLYADEAYNAVEMKFPTSCSISFEELTDMYLTRIYKNVVYYTYSDELYEKLTDCIEIREEEFRNQIEASKEKKILNK